MSKTLFSLSFFASLPSPGRSALTFWSGLSIPARNVRFALVKLQGGRPHTWQLNKYLLEKIFYQSPHSLKTRFLSLIAISQRVYNRRIPMPALIAKQDLYLNQVRRRQGSSCRISYTSESHSKALSISGMGHVFDWEDFDPFSSKRTCPRASLFPSLVKELEQVFSDKLPLLAGPKQLPTSNAGLWQWQISVFDRSLHESEDIHTYHLVVKYESN